MTETLADLNRQAADPPRWDGASVRDLIEGYIDLRLHQISAGGLSKRAIALVMADDPDIRPTWSRVSARGT